MWQIEYYSENVRAWVDLLPVDIRAHYLKLVERMELYGPNLYMPYTRAMGGGLFELRAKGKEGIARVFYCVMRNQIFFLHGFKKKTEKTPCKELDLAKRRMKEIKDENR